MRMKKSEKNRLKGFIDGTLVIFVFIILYRILLFVIDINVIAGFTFGVFLILIFSPIRFFNRIFHFILGNIMKFSDFLTENYIKHQKRRRK